MANRAVYAIATMDTKADEIVFVAKCLRDAGVNVRVVDVGTKDMPSIEPDISRADVLRNGSLPSGEDRGVAVTAMGEALADYLDDEARGDRVAGVIGIGGSGGTALITAAMRRLPVGLPKLMVSTVASGNVASYVDCSDITMMYSVVDIAGLNVVSRKVLGNAAHAMAGMVANDTGAADLKPCVGMTMFGVTTPCVTAVRKLLESDGYDCLVFHATGSGGRAMEGLVRSGLLRGVLDVTTTEVADEVVGGVLSAGPNRLNASVDMGLPLLISVGALDMVNFAAIESVPDDFRGRKLHVHNAHVTLMRTTPEENLKIAAWIAGKLNRSSHPWTLLIPEGGVSALDAPGQAFWDPEADAALFDGLESMTETSPLRRIVRLPFHINDPRFAQAIHGHYQELVSDG